MKTRRRRHRSAARRRRVVNVAMIYERFGIPIPILRIQGMGGGVP